MVAFDATLAVQVMALRSMGQNQTAIGERLGVTQGTVSRYLSFVEAATAGLLEAR